MSENPDLEELSNSCFEDEADMLEYAYEKIETSVFIWALWCRAFAPEMEQNISLKLMVNFVENIFEQISSRISVDVCNHEGKNVLIAMVKKNKKRRDDYNSLL